MIQANKRVTGTFRYVVVFDQITGARLRTYDYGTNVQLRDGDSFTLQYTDRKPITWARAIDRVIRNGELFVLR